MVQITQSVGGGKEQRLMKRQNQSAKELQRMCPIISFSRVCSQKQGSHRKRDMSYGQNERQGQTFGTTQDRAESSDLTAFPVCF